MDKTFFLKKSKHSFSLIEIIIVIAFLAIALSITLPKKQITKLDLAADRLVIYLNYIRYIAFIDNKFDINDVEWEKKRWSIKFQRCSKEADGLYFVVFSDKSGGTGAFKKAETMKDPLNNKYLYSGYDCDPGHNESKNILLTKEYGVKSIKVSCNTTSTIGQISFGYDGKIYSHLGMNIQEIKEPCIITLKDDKGDEKRIELIPNTGYIHKL